MGIGGLRLLGWRDLQTGKWWPLPEGHKKPEYTVSEQYEPVYATPLPTLPPLAFEELVKAAENVVHLAKSEDESPAVDDAFLAAMVRLRDAARAARPLVSPPGPPSPPRNPEMFS